MYKIEITYDTGSSFHHESDLTKDLDMKWEDINKAAQAIKDIEAHYTFYMTSNNEIDYDKKKREKALGKVRKEAWYSGDKYPLYSLLLENDEGERIEERTFWCGYFESLGGAAIIDEKVLPSFSHRGY